MTSTMIHFKGHSWQTARPKASMMLLTQIMTLRMVTSMKRNFQGKAVLCIFCSGYFTSNRKGERIGQRI